ncbi:NRDE family protein [Marinospirillum perlucidum]|uniref:NRDE family protein n=1 Tax=Marinospirillum perlucidum TaxID=1982602 RepID=UPI000DF3C5F4|nr:NRDE family protein [Marinospirillum perlucidum]
MCLLALAWKHHPDYPLLLAANRDEFHQRPARAAAFWSDYPEIAGGRDLEAGGSWLVATREGRWAALTNIREPGAQPPAGGLSRGDLVVQAVRQPLETLAARLEERAADYAGFNLLWGNRDQAWYLNNRSGDKAHQLEPGIHLLSNARLNTPWPKTEKLGRSFTAWCQDKNPRKENLFAKLGDSSPAPDEDLPQTGVGLELERFLSPIFIQGENYGTRASTLLWQDHEPSMTLWERSFDADACLKEEKKLVWPLA